MSQKDVIAIAKLLKTKSFCSFEEHFQFGSGNVVANVSKKNQFCAILKWIAIMSTH